MASKTKPPLVVIAGPTASGKSALALALAQQIGGVIVNADSAQIYRDLPILSAAPPADEQLLAEHRLYGFRDAAESCSVAEWAALAREVIDEVHGSRRTPILVGGTGLYIRTLLEGIAPVPEIDTQVRTAVRAAPLEENRAKLAELDPTAAARLNAADTTRINRALEVVTATGRTLADWQSSREGGVGHDVEVCPLILLPSRQWLYERCDARFADMVEDGAVDEVAALLKRGLNPKLPAMRAIGVREIAEHLGGEATLEEAVAKGQQATRRYAKRQYTWFAHQPPPEWPRFDDPLDGSTIRAALAQLKPKS